jgi:hypothetical protein
MNPELGEIAHEHETESRESRLEPERGAFVAAMAILRAENPDVGTMSTDELRELSDRINPTLNQLYDRLEEVRDDSPREPDIDVWFGLQLVLAYKEAGLLSLFEQSLEAAEDAFANSAPEVQEKWRSQFESLRAV